MKIGERIKQIRIGKGLKSYELANKIGVSPSMLSQWENGKEPSSILTLKKIADALGVSVNDLIGISDFYLDFEIRSEIIDELFENIAVNDLENVAEFLNEDKSPISRASKIIKSYLELNAAGREKAVERIEELTEIPRYRAKEED